MSKPLVPVADQPWIKRNIPLVTFFSRASTWYVLLFALVGQWAIHYRGPLPFPGFWWTQQPGSPDGTPGEWVPITLYDWLGAILLIPAICSAGFFVLMLLIHVFFRQTIDKDMHDGTYLCDWGNLDSHQRMQITAWIRIGFWIGICLVSASIAKGEIPDQTARWNAARINPAFSVALDVWVDQFKRNASRYEKIAAMRANGVPATVLACLHERESSSNFRRHPHEGSPLTGRTKFVPKGRLPRPDPPYTFEQSAEDAYYVVDRLDLVNWRDVQSAFQGIESFNGLGYQKFHPETPSPYNWNGVLINGRATVGKYTGDGHFDRYARDKQLGCAAMLMRLRTAGYRLPWE